MTVDVDIVFDPSAELADDHPLAAVHAFIGQLRDAYADVAAPPPRGDLAAMFQAERASVVVTALAPRRSAARTRTRRLRRVMLVAATVAVAVAATGGLAVAGMLPGTIQRPISDALDRVGIAVPRGEPSPAPPPTPTASLPSNVATGTTADPGAGASTNRGSTGAPAADDPPDAANTDPTAPTTTLPGSPPPVPPVTPPVTPPVLPVAPALPLPPVDPLPLPIVVPGAPLGPLAELPPADTELLPAAPPLPTDVPTTDPPPVDGDLPLPLLPADGATDPAPPPADVALLAPLLPSLPPAPPSLSAAETGLYPAPHSAHGANEHEVVQDHQPHSASNSSSVSR